MVSLLRVEVYFLLEVATHAAGKECETKRERGGGGEGKREKVKRKSICSKKTAG